MGNCSSPTSIQDTGDRRLSPTEVHEPRHLNPLMMGKTGTGKSETANSILGRDAFVSKGDFEPVTVDSKRDVAKLEDGRIIYIVDTPGVADTGHSPEEGKQKFAKAIHEAIGLCVYGYDALLLTIQFGNRLTEEDENMIIYLKKVFGEEFLKKHAIIIVTSGDSFITDPTMTCTFEEWCDRQGGIFSKLYREVNRRVIIYNNRGNPAEKESQRQKLFQMVDHMGERYTNEVFQKAAEVYQRMKLEKNLLDKDITDEMRLLLAELNSLNSENASEKMGALILLQQKFQKLGKRIDDFEPTEMSKQAKMLVSGAESQIKLEMQRLEDSKKSKQQNTELKDKLEKIKDENRELQIKWLEDKMEKLKDENRELRDKVDASWTEQLNKKSAILGAASVGAALVKGFASKVLPWLG